MRSVQNGLSPDQLSEIGRYDQYTEVVTVYARPHREPVQTLLRRHGVEADSVWVVERPGAL